MSSEDHIQRELPADILEKIKQKEDKGDYNEDNKRFERLDSKKKSKGKTISRKEQRQQEREAKKQKRIKPLANKGQMAYQKQQKQQQQQKRLQKSESQKSDAKSKAHSKRSAPAEPEKSAKKQKKSKLNDEIDEDLESDVMSKLKKIKNAKKASSTKKSEEIRIVKEDDLSSDDSFDEADFAEEEEEEEGEEEQYFSGEDFEEDEMDDEIEEDEDPMEQLRKLKAVKGSFKASEFRVIKEDDLDDDSITEDEDGTNSEELNPMEQLRRIKEAKGRSTTSSEVRVIKEDDLQDDSFDEEDFLEDGSEDEEESFEEDDEHIEDDDEEDNEDPMEKLRKLKASKKSTSSSDIRVVKEDDLQDDSLDESDFSEPKKKESKKESRKETKKKEKKEKHDRIVSVRDLDLMKKDEDDMAYYAKKLGLKNGKNAKLSKQGDDDIIGGLLDGLDFGFSDDGEDMGDFDQDDEVVDDEESGDDVEEDYLESGVEDEDGVVSFDEGDFDEDELRELREMEELENSDEEEVSDGETHMVTAKENPYVAPATSSGGYIPPALRRKMALEASASEAVSEEILNLQRSIKRLLNKLSEANVTSIMNEINQLYTSNPRQAVTENLTMIIMDSIQQQGRLLENFVTLHACIIVAVHKLQGGMEFGAYFIQTLVERFDKHLKELSGNNKEISNLVSLLSSVYTFQLVSSKLLYDIIKLLITDLSESNAELLLRLIQNSGNQMRSDDPQSLKEIILMINKHKQSTTNTRTQFLIETISSLKNNKLKVFNEGQQQLIVRMKKVLGGIGKHSDPLQVSLEDIRNVETRGKWWLVGSAWKGYDDVNNGNNQEAGSNYDFDNDMVNDILDNAEPNWVELARSQRMNTDIRRAIFISIMSANDYVDAMTKLDKLALKRAQEREIPRIIIHCTGIEPAWNPYYGVLAAKLCESHSYRKTFQFMLWDILKDLDRESGRGSDDESDNDEDFFGFDNDNDIDEDIKLKKILNLGRFFAYLLAEGSLPLNILRNINFLGTVGDTLLFLEILFVTFLDHIAKKSQLNSVGAGHKKKKSSMSEIKFDERTLIERVGKAHEQPILLKGIRYFLDEKARKSAFITGRKQRVRVDWGINTMCDLIDDLLKGSDY